MRNLYYCSFKVEIFGVIYIASFNNALVFLHTEKSALIKYAESIEFELIEDHNYNKLAIDQVKEYFSGQRQEFLLNIEFLTGTDFQKKIWQELIKVPYGKTTNYKDISQKVHHEKATRATGTAIGKNPIPVVIPCHRIVRSNGELGGFSLGLDKKQYLLDLEDRYK